MISKGLRGADLPGVMRYLFSAGRAEEHTNQRVVACSDPTWNRTTTPDREMLKQFIAEMDDPKVRHGDHFDAGYVFHVPISLPAGDGQLTDAQWRHVAETFAGKLGLDERVRWAAIHHGVNVNGNDHVHLVVNLIREDGTGVGLSYDRLRRREACRELEDEYGLTATAAAGRGQPGSLSRREVEQLRGGEVADVADLSQHRIAATVRAVATGVRSEEEFVARLRGEGLVVTPRYAKKNGKHDPTIVTGYKVAAKTRGREPLVYYGGGTLGKDLRLPALRARWNQPAGDAAAWAKPTPSKPPAEPRHVAGASDALGRVADAIGQIPAGDAATWQRVTADTAGVLSAAATVSSDPQARRALLGAAQALHRATPGIDPAATATTTAAIDWPEPVRMSYPAGGATLGGVARVVMASQTSGASRDSAVTALISQAVQLSVQVARTLAAQQQATQAQQRAVTACAAAQNVVTAAAPARAANMWRSTKSGSKVLEEARNAAPASEVNAVPRHAAAPEQGLGR